MSTDRLIFNKQVDKLHYEFMRYMSKPRWISLWYQIYEVIKLKPSSVLEIGLGSGIFKSSIIASKINIETLDFDAALEPDYVSSVLSMPFDSDTYEVVCAFQVLEHLPYDKSLEAFSEIARVASKTIIISLPDAARCWPISIYIPKLGVKNILIHLPRFFQKEHVFDNQHYWELNKKNYALQKIMHDFSKRAPVKLLKSYRVPDNPYHRFFIYSKI